MHSDELLNFGFASQTVYPPEKQYSFLTDEAFGSFLHLHYPEVEDVLDSVRAGKMKLKHFDRGIAAISVFPSLTLWLNFNKITAMREKCGLLEVADFYETLACLLLHEKSHYSLQHFRIPFPAFDNNLMNIAQDMVIDSRIHRKNSQWRNWQELITQINRRIDETNAVFPKISTDPKDRYYILNLSDLDIYCYLVSLKIQNPQTPPRFDEHNWAGSPDSSGNNQGNKPGDKPGNNQGNNQGNQPGEQQGNQKGEGPNVTPLPAGPNGPQNSDGNGQGQNSSDNQNEQSAQNSPDAQADKTDKKDPSDSAQGDKTQNEGDNSAQANKPQNSPDNQDGQSGKNLPDDSSGMDMADKNDTADNDGEKELPKGFDDLMDEWCAKSRARLSQNDERFVPENALIMDKMMHVIACGKEHNLFNLLQKFIKKISYKQTRYTWKKISKKQPYNKPGIMYKKTPGEVLLMIDTSGSMHEFINKHIAEMVQAIYAAFVRLSRVYGVPSRMYKADVDDRVLNFKRIEKVEELKEIDLAGGGGNDFEHIFDKLVLHWKEQTRSSQKFPDFILVLTDFGDDWHFLDRPEYKEVAEKIIWLSTDPYYLLRPSKGYIINVLSDDWSVSIR